jgi:drug/metabolite transporter (DMT)-like permease
VTRQQLMLAYGALVAVSFFWGTTYAGIRMALEMFAPVQLMAFRFLLSGILMLSLAWMQGAVFPKGRELWLTALYGLIALGIGNFCLTYAETFVPSGLASIIIATSPFWMVGLEALVPGGAKLHAPTVAGMIVGLLGSGCCFSKTVRDSRSHPGSLPGSSSCRSAASPGASVRSSSGGCRPRCIPPYPAPCNSWPWVWCR